MSTIVTLPSLELISNYFEITFYFQKIQLNKQLMNLSKKEELKECVVNFHSKCKIIG